MKCVTFEAKLSCYDFAMLTRSPAMLQLKDISAHFVAAREGNAAAHEALHELIYDALKQLARTRLAEAPPGNALQPALLVRETYEHLLGSSVLDDYDRGRYYCLAASMMRRILVRHEEGVALRSTSSSATAMSFAFNAQPQILNLVRLDAALDELAALDSREAQVAELRLFGGLELEQIADVLNVTLGVVRRDWSMAKMWLGRELVA